MMERNIRYLPVQIGTRAMHADLPEESEEKYWIRVLASNDKLDAHYSIMDPDTTLRNFEADAKEARGGVAFKDHHEYRSFGYGRTVDARLDAQKNLFIDGFILKGREYSGRSCEFRDSADLIRSIENGLVTQASVGFFEAREICNLCQMPIRQFYDMFYYDFDDIRGADKCPHTMGEFYEIDGQQVRATYTVMDARLKEVSFVEFGSNRHTSIETVRAWMATPDASRVLNRVLEDKIMNDKEWTEALRERLDLPNLRSTDEAEETLKKLTEEVTTLRDKISTQADEIADLTEDAEDGQAYRDAQIAEGLKQGVRAYGEAFDEEFHKTYFANLPMEQLEKQIEHLRGLAKKALPPGRKTTDPAPPEEKPEGTRRRRLRRHRK